MGYKIDYEVFEKITYEGIRKSPETLAFLKKEANEIFLEEAIKWEGAQELQEDRDDPELWCEYLRDAEKKLEKYLYRWFGDVNNQVSLRVYENKLPSEIVGIFQDYLDAIWERIDFESFSIELLEGIFEDHKQKKLEVK